MAKTCYPPDWTAPLVFDPPWASRRHNWYQTAPSSAYPRLAATAFSPCGVVNPEDTRGKTFKGVVPSPRVNLALSGPTTCTSGPRHGFNAVYSLAARTPVCSASQPCPAFQMCDFRYGAEGQCGQPNFGGQAT